MTEFAKKLYALTAPYRGRLALGVFFGFLAGLMEPVLLIVVAVVYNVVFGGTELPGGNKWPEWLRDWVAQFGNGSFTEGGSAGSAILLLALIPVVFFVKGV